jgi:hypothetical protein
MKYNTVHYHQFALHHFHMSGSVQIYFTKTFKIINNTRIPQKTLLCQKVTGFLVVKKFPSFYRNSREITMFREALLSFLLRL